jgi:hypothetical protein
MGVRGRSGHGRRHKGASSLSPRRYITMKDF